jgi:hypothetical protein
METVLLIMRFLFAFKLFLKTAIEVAHRNDGSRSVISNTPVIFYS